MKSNQHSENWEHRVETEDADARGKERRLTDYGTKTRACPFFSN